MDGAAYLRKGLKDKGFRQKDLAEKLHVSESAVQKWCTGKNSIPADMISEIAYILDMSPILLINPYNILNAKGESNIMKESHIMSLNMSHVDITEDNVVEIFVSFLDWYQMSYKLNSFLDFLDDVENPQKRAEVDLWCTNTELISHVEYYQQLKKLLYESDVISNMMKYRLEFTTNPCTQFQKRMTAGKYDDVSDDEWMLLWNDVQRVSEYIHEENDKVYCDKQNIGIVLTESLRKCCSRIYSSIQIEIALMMNQCLNNNVDYVLSVTLMKHIVLAYVEKLYWYGNLKDYLLEHLDFDWSSVYKTYCQKHEIPCEYDVSEFTGFHEIVCDKFRSIIARKKETTL